MRYFAGLDIGGTHGRLKLCDEAGNVLGIFQEEGCSINTDGYEKSRLRCRALVLPALEKLGLTPQECAGICAAVSGIDSLSLETAMRSIFEEMGFRPEYLQIFNDCEVFLHLSDRASLVLVSGTGSICFGRGPDGTVVRTGGWNHILSDEGSGFDMGLKVLKAAAEVLDGRRSASVLTDQVMSEEKMNTLEFLNDFINVHLFEKSGIAAFAETAYEAALSGDETALEIHECCADALYRLVSDTIRKLNMETESAELWLWGSMTEKNRILREMLIRKIHETFPNLQAKIPSSSALDVSVKIAEESCRGCRKDR